MVTKYWVHRLDVRMSTEKSRLEQLLNGLEGEVVAIIPGVFPKFTYGGMGAKVFFLWIVEKLS